MRRTGRALERALRAKGGIMADFSATISTLQQQRRELLDQVAAIDRAIAALSGTDRPYRSAARMEAPAAPPEGRARRAKKRTFVLSEEHKRKLIEGQQRAREKRLVAEHAEAADAPGPATAAWTGSGAPRLVKPPVEP